MALGMERREGLLRAWLLFRLHFRILQDKAYLSHAQIVSRDASPANRR